MRGRCNQLISKLCESEAISAFQAKCMKTYTSVSPKAYGLRKTHKEQIQYRPVISNINAPSYKLSRYVHEILSSICSTMYNSMKNSMNAVEIIRNIDLPLGYVIISLDVVDKNWDFIECYTNSNKVFIQIINFLFESNYFSFNKKFYIQLS